MTEFTKLLDSFLHLDHINPEDLPNIDLYMDQVTTFMESQLSGCKRSDDDKILTKTMINNYSKNKLLPPSDKKKYSKDHIILLIFIYYLKNFLSISDIKALMTPLSNAFHDNKNATIPMEHIYKELHDMITDHHDTFREDVFDIYKDSQKSFSDVPDEKQKELLSHMAFIFSLSYDIYLKKQIIEGIIDQYIPAEEMKVPSKAAKDKKNKRK